MYHVDNSTGVPVMPQPSPVTSETELFFTEGGNGVPPTFPGPDWFNIIQSELINILRAAGLDPDKMDNTQILAALKKLFLSRSNPFGDIKADGAAAIATALSNLGLRASGQYTDNLLFTGPDGLKIQVFRRTLANQTTVGVVNTVPVTFPVPFPVNCWGVFSTKSTWVQIANSCEWVSNTGFTAQVMMNIAVNTNTSEAMFLAIGY
ncbi:TPA: gp53-like domain-containing protein [Citrobacter freundii]